MTKPHHKQSFSNSQSTTWCTKSHRNFPVQVKSYTVPK